MWVQAQFAPETFWHQTPRHYQLAMEGVRKRLQAEFDARIRQAWETGLFTGAAQAGKLKPLKTYLPSPNRAQSGSEMLAAMRAFEAKGAKMTFRKIERRT